MQFLQQDSNLEIGYNASENGTLQRHIHSGQYYDWGKHRHSISIEETVAWYLSLAGTYNYILDGTGVDVVIQDSGIQLK